MKFEPIFPKSKKKTLDEKILETDVQLRTLDDKFHTIISREIRALRYNKNDRRAKEKIKSSIYSLMILRSAQEALRDIDTTNELNKAMNSLASALNSINGISNRSEHLNEKKLERSVTRMNRDTDTRGGMSINTMVNNIDTLVSDDIVERLLKGDEIDTCLMEADGELKDTADSMFTGTDFLDEVNFGEEKSKDILNEFKKIF